MDESLRSQKHHVGTTRNILMDLMELLLQAMEEDNGANVSNLDNYLMGFSTTRMTNDMDVHTLPYSSWLWQNITQSP
jgi:hypothetical protein